jgi:hypothetical protein
MDWLHPLFHDERKPPRALRECRGDGNETNEKELNGRAHDGIYRNFMKVCWNNP